ncbi:hypothetical protein KBX21_24855 [Nocardiopsis sp. B62]|nr:hypothetical protein [Nocardiopsis sp. B62]
MLGRVPLGGDDAVDEFGQPPSRGAEVEARVAQRLGDQGVDPCRWQ